MNLANITHYFRTASTTAAWRSSCPSPAAAPVTRSCRHCLQERERRRHHMLLVKALDARRRQEERDRRREDMKVERAALKERRREKRLQDAEVIRQLKKPRLWPQSKLGPSDRVCGCDVS